MSDRPSRGIRRPDQRLRVFVSSTLRELEPERTAVRRAIEALHLAPVMFELGARPHPPRDLYRAYLEQSDVFVGLYWESYGWVAPDEQISGLEDEYRLAPVSMPRLIYLKEPAERHDRLEELIARIRADDAVSYKSFSTPEELAELVAADLATLLAERFDAARERRADGPVTTPLADSLPVPYTPLIGQEAELARVAGMLAEDGTRLVTVLGPGGIGKSRLAIEVARSTEHLFPGGRVFVPLENVLEPDLLLPTIGYALGVRDAGELPLEERLAIALGGRRMLIVLDNFEQLVDAAAVLARLMQSAPDASFLVTSRTILRLRGERVFDLPPLASNDPAAPESTTRALGSPGVRLLVERARAAKPDFEVTDANSEAVVAICRMLDGLPLALELAAARLRVLTPAAIVQRLDRQLPLLVDASRDLPERQRTLRSTIEWSTDLLDEPVRRVLHDLSVFSPGFTLESVEAFGDARAWDVPAMDALAVLVDSSLLQQADAGGEAVFTMLASVREFGVEQLRELGQEDAARAAHAEVYVGLARREGRGLGFSRQLEAVTRLNLERGNLRAAVRHLAAAGQVEIAAETAWGLYLYWWVGGYLTEVAVWMEELLAGPRDAVPGRTRAIAAFYVCWRDMWQSPSHDLPATLLDAAELFEADGDLLGAAMAIATAGLAEINTSDPDIGLATEWLQDGAARFRALGAGWGEALALVALGRMAQLTGTLEEATEHFRRALAAASGSGDRFVATVAMHNLARMLLFAGSLEDSEALLRTAVEGSLLLQHEEGIAYGLEGLCAVAAERGDAERAGVLAGAAETIRRRTAIFDAPAFVYHTRYIEALLASPGAGAERETAFRAAEARGRELGAAEAAATALERRSAPV